MVPFVVGWILSQKRRGMVAQPGHFGGLASWGSSRWASVVMDGLSYPFTMLRPLGAKMGDTLWPGLSSSGMATKAKAIASPPHNP